MPGFPIHYQHLELAQTHIHRVSDAIQPLSSTSSCLQFFPASGSFPMSQFSSGGQSIGASASAPVLPVNIQDQFPLRLTGLISLQAKGLSKVLSNAIVQRHQFLSAQLSFFMVTSIHDKWEKKDILVYMEVCKEMFLLFNMLSRLVIAFLPRSKCLLILWLQSQSAVISEPKRMKSVTVSIVPPSICM